MKPTFHDLTNPVTAAVLPLKEAAIGRAEREARDLIARIKDDLDRHGWNLDAAAPAVRDVWSPAYKKTQSKRALYRAVTTYTKPSRSFGEPEILKASVENEERFVDLNREAAGLQYDAFVVKLVGKVGEVVDASLSGSHVWGYSILTITKADGSVERWQTQQIVNQSKHALLYNQWPTRKLKR